MRQYAITVRAFFDGHQHVYHTTAHCVDETGAVEYAIWLVWNKFPRGEMWRRREYMIDAEDWQSAD